ncbi:MAG: 16S rRNA (cytosine(967)-C(5))-methyltransferase RsmB [Clostridia bacterium]|nr:16S rRNA (cytosine(967)-C(5))-methyltransferase RsmB [Clostridia bacterium]
MGTGRRAAVEALIRIEKDGAYSNIVVGAVSKQFSLDSRESAFASALVYGVTERRITLEFILERYSKIKINKLDTAVKYIIFTALYQLLYMDKVPDSAAVNEAVKLCTLMKFGSASGYVNGVLRSFLRDNKEIKYPDSGDFLKYNSVKYSCPVWLIRKWRGQYGEKQCLQILESSLGNPPVYARVNTLKTDAEGLIKTLNNEGVSAVKYKYLENCLILSDTGDIEKLQSFKDGLFHIQDAASQLCCMMAGAKPGDTALDVCAAPGGKSFTTAQYMCNAGKLYSHDLFEHKLKLVDDGANRLGISVLEVSLRDAAGFDGNENESADLVLCDVPCSGFGIIRRKPEIKYKAKESISELTKIQSEILSASARLVKPGGKLMFSTCTLDRDENGTVKRFLEAHPEFAPVPLELPQNIEHQIREENYELTLFPGVYGTDGFYFALITRLK